MAAWTGKIYAQLDMSLVFLIVKMENILPFCERLWT